MEVKDVFALANERKKGQRRLDLFRRGNLEPWILYFPPGDGRGCTITHQIGPITSSAAAA